MGLYGEVDCFSESCSGSQVFYDLKYFLEALFGMKMSKAYSSVRGWGVDYCFRHVSVESSFA